MPSLNVVSCGTAESMAANHSSASRKSVNITAPWSYSTKAPRAEASMTEIQKSVASRALSWFAPPNMNDGVRNGRSSPDGFVSMSCHVTPKRSRIQA